jgi:hypothetical protein
MTLEERWWAMTSCNVEDTVPISAEEILDMAHGGIDAIRTHFE